MPTTANGTSYTVRSATVGGTTCYWGCADAAYGAPDIPTVLYAHGAGGAANQFASLSAWSGLRDWMIDNGIAWIEGSGGSSQNWGRPGTMEAYEAYIAHVRTVMSVGDIALLGRSMGGLVTSQMLTKSTMPYAGWINSSGVSTMFTGSENPDAPAIEKSTGRYFTSSVIWGAWGESTYDGWASAVRAADAAPEEWPSSVWAGKKILNLYGTADTSVPWYPRGASALRSAWSGLPDIDDVVARQGGDHGSNGTYFEVQAMSTFLATVFELTPPMPPEGVRWVRGMFRINGDGLRVPVALRMLDS